jgi:enolase
VWDSRGRPTVEAEVVLAWRRDRSRDRTRLARRAGTREAVDMRDEGARASGRATTLLHSPAST